MSDVDIDNIVIFKKNLGLNLEVSQSYVGLKAKENNILAFNFRVPENEKDNIVEYFKKFKIREPILVDIGNTGNISCYFIGISPVVKKQEKDLKYYFISLTLEEVKNVPPSDEGNGHTCHQCGLH